MVYTYTAQGAWEVTAGTGSEGTAVLSTGETGGTKYLREDGDGTSSWQAVAAGGGGIGEFISTSIAISSDDTALANDDGTDNKNIGIGTNSGNNLTTGVRNTLLGDKSGQSISSGGYNVIIGDAAGQYVTSGSYNMVLGANAGLVGTMSNGYNTMFGANTGWYTSGAGNTLIGDAAGQKVSSGSYNIALGKQSLQGNSTSKLTGSHNIGVGYEAGHNLSTGQYNVLNGYQAGYKVTDGQYNIALGYNVMSNATMTGQFNTCMQYQAGNNLTSGGNNVYIGNAAGKTSDTGSKNVCIGYSAGAGIASASNKLHIANNATESLIEGDFSARTVNINGALSVNGTAVGGGGGAMEFISKTTVSSNVSSVAFTGLSGYNTYKLIFTCESTHVTFVRCQIYDSGSLVTADGAYDYRLDYDSSATTGNSQTHWAIYRGGAGSFFGELIFMEGTNKVNMRGHTGGLQGSNVGLTDVAAGTDPTVDSISSFTGIKLYPDSGNITSGTFSLYGIKDS
jgi:hypothetical protein